MRARMRSPCSKESVHGCSPGALSDTALDFVSTKLKLAQCRLRGQKAIIRVCALTSAL